MQDSGRSGEFPGAIEERRGENLASKPYTFTYGAPDGPHVERFDDLHTLAAFVAGWCKTRATEILVPSITDWRAP